MHQEQRALYNAAFSDATYASFVRRFEAKVGPVPFRLAETPLFMTHALRDRLARHAREIVAQLSRPELLATLKKAVPAHYHVPGADPLPNCVQVDFALVEGPDGTMDGRVVELQAFPSLYALMTVKADTWAEVLREMPGLDLPWDWAVNGDRERAYELMRRTIVAATTPRRSCSSTSTPRTRRRCRTSSRRSSSSAWTRSASPS
jgi:hypothetical protein